MAHFITADFLLEIFGEEIPARMQKNAADALKVRLTQAFQGSGLNGFTLETYITPRRLVALASQLPIQTEATQEERRGPKVSAPEAALLGFLKSTQTEKDQLIERNGYWYAMLNKPAKATQALLPEIVRGILADFPWPKTMRWSGSSIPWIRPIRSITCLFQDQPVIFSIPDLGISTSGNIQGHRFLSPEKRAVCRIALYEEMLKEAFVILRSEERQQIIMDSLKALVHAKGLHIQEDGRLLEEIAGLVEYPVAMLGSIDAKFMHLPKAVLSTSMRVHQKYFTIVDRSGGAEDIAPFFGVIANKTASDGGKAMLHGYEKVLKARLTDAAFFYEQDMKVPLESLLPKLDTIVFHARLGTQGDRVRRLEALLDTADEQWAARLCKLDLLTQMVGEFPELQGIMGTHYAQKQGIVPSVAESIADHYLPLGPESPVPTSPIGIALSLADKADMLTGFFSIGEEPTGSKDPFALRRAALGIIRILREHQMTTYDIEALIRRAAQAHAPLSSEDLTRSVMIFLLERLKVSLKADGMRHDIITAVIEGQRLTDQSFILYQTIERTQMLQAFLSTEVGNALLLAFRRANSLLSDEEKKDEEAYRGEFIAPEFFQEDAEKDLYQQLANLSEKVQYDTSYLEGLASIQKNVEDLFALKINHENPQVRCNRLNLLGLFVGQVLRVADFSCVQDV